MSRIVYVNGEFVAEEDAKVSVFDRGFLFADAVYEVSTVLQGNLVDNAAHLRRLAFSLGELNMAPPCSDEDIMAAQQKLLELNGVEEGLVYLQVSRGVADRDFGYPDGMQSSLVMFTQEKKLMLNAQVDVGIKVITVDDIRWKRRDIKTVGLLAPNMAKHEAKQKGANDAWLVEDGYITEGTSNNAYIVTHDNQIVTRQLGHEILSGITRTAVLKFASSAGYEVQERAFTVQEAKEAQEAFITSASMFVMPVVAIDGTYVGNGKPGPIAKNLRKIYIDEALNRRNL